MKRAIRQFVQADRLRRWIVRLIGGLGVLALLLFATANCWLPAIGYWLRQPERLHTVDALVIFDGGNPERLQQGIALYQQGLAPELWHTGDIVWPGETHSDAQAAARRAIAQGVPAEDIHLLPTTSTWEDGAQVAALAERRQIDSVLIITDWWHSRRALCALYQHLDSGVNVYFSPASSPFGPTTWWHSTDGREAVTSELLKFGYYWLRYGMVPWHC